MSSTKVIFGGILALILLGIYAYLVTMALLVVFARVAPNQFTAQMASSLSLIGGLVSALVIAELAVTPPGQTPGMSRLDSEVSIRARTFFAIVVLLYLAVWTSAGVMAFIFGYLQHHGTLTSLTDMGQSWIGIAIAAGYSYFGIKPK